MSDSDDEAVFQEIARDHAIRTIFLMSCAALGYDSTVTKQLVMGLTEQIRRERFPTYDPATAMYAADGVADAFEDLMALDERSIAMLNLILQWKK